MMTGLCLVLPLLLQASDPRTFPALADDWNPEALGARTGEKWPGDVGFRLGGKKRFERRWRSLDGNFGVTADLRPPGLPVYIALDALGGGFSPDATRLVAGTVLDDGSGADVEIDPGVRWRTGLGGPFCALVGGGLTFEYVLLDPEVDRGRIERLYERKWAVGGWVQAAATVDVGMHWNAGLEIRWTTAEATLFGRRGNVGGLGFAAVAESSW